MVVQCLTLGAFTSGAQIGFLVGEISYCKLHGTAKKQTSKKQNKITILTIQGYKYVKGHQMHM